MNCESVLVCPATTFAASLGAFLGQKASKCHLGLEMLLAGLGSNGDTLGSV